MRLDEYLFRNKLTAKAFADSIGMGQQTFFNVLKGKNCTRDNIARVLAATGFQVEFWELMPEDLIEEFKKQPTISKCPPKNTMSLPTNDELMEHARKARWDSKFSGMCC